VHHPRFWAAAMLPGLLLKSRLLRARFHTRDYMVGAIVHFLHTFFWLTDAHAPVASERGLRACPIHLACPNRCPAMHEEPSLVLYGGVPAWTSLERLPAAQAACPPAVLAVGRLGQRLSLQTRKLTWGMCFLFLLSRKLTAGPDVRVCTLRPYRSDPAGPPSQDLRGARLGARCSKPRAPHALCSALCKHTASKSC